MLNAFLVALGAVLLQQSENTKQEVVAGAILGVGFYGAIDQLRAA